MKFLTTLLLSTCTVFAAAPANALNEAATKALAIKGVAVTGINRVLGEPIFDFGAPHGTVGFFTVACYNPAGPDPLPLTPDSPLSSILATAVDPDFLAVFGVKLEDVDPSRINVPLRDIPVISDFTGVKQPLRDHRTVGQMHASRSVSIADPITLGQWMKAGGSGSITCPPKHSPRVELSMHGLIPHGLYTAWGGMLTTLGPRPIALGGVPNAFVADESGNAKFSARLNYCPMALRPGELPLSFIDILYHADHTLYGAVGELIQAGSPTGIVTMIQIEFPVSVTPVN
jgi:hypothetical protein